MDLSCIGRCQVDHSVSDCIKYCSQFDDGSVLGTYRLLYISAFSLIASGVFGVLSKNYRFELVKVQSQFYQIRSDQENYREAWDKVTRFESKTYFTAMAANTSAGIALLCLSMYFLT